MDRNYPLNCLNTWRAGGSCELYCAPADTEQARGCIKACRAECGQIYILGGGSNVLISDGLIHAAVLHTANLNGIAVRRGVQTGSYQVEIGAGVETKALLALCWENQLGGLEFLTGIPGTAGGALWGSAGAAGESLSALVDYADVINADGETVRLPGNSLRRGYRSCPFGADEVLLVTSFQLLLKEAPREQIAARMSRFAALKKGQPLGSRTAGCVFKNPLGDVAGRLLEAAGCKGLRIGGAVVSKRHANFIENAGGAAAADIYALCEECRRRVKDMCGVELEYEIRFIGGFAKNTAAG